MPPPPPVDLAVAGGGAAGFFAAIHAKLGFPGSHVVLLEKSREFLAKVAISGGGRCNLTHACFDPARLISHYPRGARELLGPFHRFQPSDTLRWFESRGVPLKTEPDGRIFPTSNSSADIVDTLLREALRLDVRLHPGQGLLAATPTPEGFLLDLTDGSRLHTRGLLIATGGNRNSGGWDIAARLGHTIIPPVPSLFSFHIRHPLLQDLAGIAVDPVELSIPAFHAHQNGPLLITHQGLSGPAVLKLSAWQARRFAESRDSVDLLVNWTGGLPPHEVLALFAEQRRTHGSRSLHNHPLFSLPRRLWERLLLLANIPPATPWSRLPSPQQDQLLTLLTASPLPVRGKTLNKDEFVTCGGVDLREINFKSFQSRLHPRLWFAGEVLDIDGITGGFNFQAAWTGGFLAGSHAASELQTAS